MTAKTNTKSLTGCTRTKALAVGALLLAMVGASLLAPSVAQASAFPGRNGEIVFASTRTTGAGVNNPEGDLEIFAMNPAGSGLEQLTFNQAADSNPSYSADGKKIVFDSQRTGNFEVFVMDADGTGQKNLTQNPARDFRPSFSPNGNKIAFDSDRGAMQGNIFVMNSDGTAPTQLTTNVSNDFNATFSPKANKIAFVSDRGGGDTEVFVMNPDGTAQNPLTQNDVKDEDPTFSPDAGKIAFASNRDGLNSNDFDVFQMNSDGSSPQRFTGSSARDDLPAFSPDGEKIAYTSTQNGGDRDVLVINSDFNPSGPVDLTLNSDTDEAPDWQPLSATIFTVTTAADADDGFCDSNCSLREAINAANTFQAQPRATIEFAIPETGVKTIHVGATGLGPLPPVATQATIDGYTQTGASPNTRAVGDDAKLMVELEGSNTDSFADGLLLNGASHSTIKGLVINRFDGAGIQISGNAIGTNVQGNFLGTDVTGTLERGNNGNGVAVFSDDITGTIIGGTTPAARNVISGNDGTGVGMGDGDSQDSPSDSIRVQGNYIGTDRTGTQDFGNGASGIFLSNVSNATIGGTTTTSGNVVSGNAVGGLDFSGVSGSRVLGNRIGTSANGADALGNNQFGIFLQGFGDEASFNSIGNGTAGGSNTIAFNNGDGIRQFDTGIGNRISHNSIFANFESGIDLGGNGPTANDGDDPSTSQADPDGDSGPNELQNFPVLSSAKVTSTGTTIAGNLDSTPGKSFTIQFFSNPSGDEGKTFMGTKSVTTDGNGSVSFTFATTIKVAPGQSVTATATNPTGSTSEFSAPKAVSDALAPIVKGLSPAPGATRVSPSANVSANCSEAMSPSTINTSTVTLKKAGATTKVGATVSYDAASKKATLNPNANLKRGATYVATVTTGARDLAGNALDQSPGVAGNQPKSWKFTIRK